MFSQPPETPTVTTNNHKSTRKKRKKQKQKKKREANKIKQSLANTMSDWAKNFTMVSTWQMKHQVAMWKARATALEYENQVLRETLRQFYGNGKPASFESHPNCNNTINLTDYEQSYEECKPNIGTCEQFSEEDSDGQDDQSDQFVITDQFMEFLRQNYKYRKARDERKKRKAEEERSQESKEIMDPKPPNDRIEEFKELYGDAWQRVAALDCYVSVEFMSLCDSAKPDLWPNIPLRL